MNTLSTDAFEVNFEVLDERVNFICEEAVNFLSEDEAEES